MHAHMHTLVLDIFVCTLLLWRVFESTKIAYSPQWMVCLLVGLGNVWRQFSYQALHPEITFVCVEHRQRSGECKGGSDL